MQHITRAKQFPELRAAGLPDYAKGQGAIIVACRGRFRDECDCEFRMTIGGAQLREPSRKRQN
jgi:hypothetical protein